MKLRILIFSLIGIISFNKAWAQYPTYKLPAYRTAQEKQLMIERSKQQNSGTFGKTGSGLPSNIRYPGEFEESQAICISWSYDYNLQGNIIGVDTFSEYGFMSAQLAKYISDELPVWIRIPKASDSITILTFMKNLDWELTQNVKFVVADGDDWWMRDFGPIGVYYGNADSLAFVDMKYYDGRDKDNLYPRTIASILNVPNFETKLNAEGGNLMTDGFGKIFFSDVITDVNNQIFGWSNQRTFDTVKSIFGSKEIYNLTALNCDGGTGHIDLYTKLLDEQTLVVMQYPSEITAIDKQIIEDNYQLFTTLKSTYNRPFRIYRFPMPTGDDSTYNRKTCNQIDEDARTFMNSITLNKTLLYPSYSNETDGNMKQTEEATALYQKLLPGYKIIPIDARPASVGGGSIHCITMQIPADNPVLFWHPSIDGKSSIAPSYAITARITNKSGIASAVCKWRKRGDTTWNTLILTADTGNYFNGQLVLGTLVETDMIDYYLEAVTNNGKTAVKPITAPQGFYTIRFTEIPTSVNEPIEIIAKNYLYAAFPNPTEQIVNIPFQLIEDAQVTITLFDLTGKEITAQHSSYQSGLHTCSFDVSNLASGLYFYNLKVNNQLISSRKFIVR